MDKFVIQVKAGGDRNFTYIFGDDKECAVVDPSYDIDAIEKELKKCGCKPRWILLTHGHGDHCGSAEPLAMKYGARVAAYRKSVASFDKALQDGDALMVGGLKVKVIYTPGHTDDSVCYLCGEWLFTGDTLFVGKVGGTDYGKGAEQEYHSLHERLLILPDETVVYPGHDVGVKPVSTIGEEKAENPFLLRESYEDFLDLKKNWLQYKQEHGIA